MPTSVYWDLWLPTARPFPDTVGPTHIWPSLAHSLLPEDCVPNCWLSSTLLLRQGRENGQSPWPCTILGGYFPQALIKAGT